MRIGILTDVYRSGFSGVANHVLLLNRTLDQMGHEAFVFAFENKNFSAPEPDVVYSPGIVVTANYPFGFYLSKKADELIKTMDILHIHQPFASGRIAVQQHRKTGIPLVFTSHTRYDLFSNAYLPWMPKNLILPALKQYLRRFASQLNLIIAPDPEMEILLRTWNVQTPIQVIPNGIDLSAFGNNEGPTANLRSKFRIPDNFYIFIYAGRIAPEKNLHFLIECFSRLIKKNNNVALILIGGGPKSLEINNLISSFTPTRHLFMTGPIAYDEMPDYMRAADAFITVSKTEVHPLTVIEAAASGLPIIGLRAPGLNSIVQDQVTGFLCEDSIDDVVEKMQILSQNKDVSLQMGTAAFRSVEKYSCEATAQHTLEAYQWVLEMNKTSSQ